jgi:hypothetical protein
MGFEKGNVPKRGPMALSARVYQRRKASAGAISSTGSSHPELKCHLARSLVCRSVFALHNSSQQITRLAGRLYALAAELADGADLVRNSL